MCSRFQSSPVPKDGCNWVIWKPRTTRWIPFQSSPVPKDGCNRYTACDRYAIGCFNPHPSRRTGATVKSFAGVVDGEMFQSSPVPKDGCNREYEQRLNQALRVSILTRPEGRVQLPRVPLPVARRPGFNPHPSRRTGATRRPSGCRCRATTFQSSPVPKDGCNLSPADMEYVHRDVSILTRPGGRVQQDGDRYYVDVVATVSILTRPGGRVQRMCKAPSRPALWLFQSSPVPEDGCNCEPRLHQPDCGRFQSSPVPEDGCNRGKRR